MASGCVVRAAHLDLNLNLDVLVPASAGGRLTAPRRMVPPMLERGTWLHVLESRVCGVRGRKVRLVCSLLG